MDANMEKDIQSKSQRNLLENLLCDFKIPSYDVAQNFPVFATRRNIARFLTHYELFKKIYELPGSIVELGVFKGAGVFTWAKLCEIFCPTDIIKKVYSFDTFEGFPALSEEDGPRNTEYDRIIGGYNGGPDSKKILESANAAFMADKHLRAVERIEFIEGDVINTIPRFVKEKGNGLKICLLNLDLDLYEPTKIALEYFVPRMVKGGIIILDEYAIQSFGGETKAVDEYFNKKYGSLPLIKKFHWHTNPSGYIVKE